MNSQFAIALHILGFLASQKGKPLTSEVMAQSYGTNPVVLRRILAKLKRAKLVETQRGVHGGSVLSRDPSSITLRDAYEAVVDVPELIQRHPDNCSGLVAPELARYLNDLISDAEKALLAELESVTVARMDKDVRRRITRASRTARA